MKKIEFKVDTTRVNTTYAIGYKGCYETKTFELIELYYLFGGLKTLLAKVPRKEKWLIYEIANIHNKKIIEKELEEIRKW